MPENVIHFLKNDLNDEHSPAQSFSVLQEGNISYLNRDSYDDLPTANHMSFIIRNWDDLNCLNEKFDELREKEIDNIISDFERDLMRNLLEKRISEFPNPHLPSDHKDAMDAIEKFRFLEGKLNKKTKYKNKKLSGLFGLFSWLG